MAKIPKGPDQVDQIRTIVRELSEKSAGISTVAAKKLRDRLASVRDEVAELSVGLDKFREPISFFDPSNPALVGSFVGIGLVAQERHPLDEIAPFYGSGVYAIYYDGPHPAYKPLVKTEHPIYVGKADPDSPRARQAREQGRGLWHRLSRDHARAIKSVTGTGGLDIAHFTCRFLVVQSGWQTAAEDYLIELFKPVWNDETRLCWGIGKHGDKAETRGNKRSPWDTMHPGRGWAGHKKLEDKKPRHQIVADLHTHFASVRPFKDSRAILRQFFDELKQK